MPSVIITSPDLLATIGKIAVDHGFSTERIFVLDETSFSLSQAEGVNYEDSDSDLSRDFGSDDGSLIEIPPQLALCKPFSTLMDHGEADWVRLHSLDVSKTKVAALFSTSGTSGLPKVAPISHYALIAQHEVLYYKQPYAITHLATVPLFHLIGSLFTHLFPIRYGQPTYILRKFKSQDFVSAVRKYNITDVAVVPNILHKLLQHKITPSCSPSSSTKQSLKSLRYIFCAGSILDSPSLNSFYRDLLSPSTVITQLYGMTEIGCITCFPYPQRDMSGSIGRLLPGMELKIVNDGSIKATESSPTTQDPLRSIGEAYVRGPGTAVMGYRRKPGDKTLEPILDKDGWLATGDLVEVVDGKYFIIGRVKEIMKIRGYVLCPSSSDPTSFCRQTPSPQMSKRPDPTNQVLPFLSWQVSPTELESTLLSHPLITDAAVKSILLPDGITEAIRAWVVVASNNTYTETNNTNHQTPQTGKKAPFSSSSAAVAAAAPPPETTKQITEQDIYDYTRKRLASYKALDGGVVIVREIPRTGSGKVIRWRLN